MTLSEKRLFLIDYLLREGNYKDEIPKSEYEQRRLLRSLMNVRSPKPVGQDFLTIQDEYLKEIIEQKGVTLAGDLNYRDDIALWKGDITALKVDGIVNAANSQMLGCFCPCHGCIDNAIHTYAGVELRLTCDKIMKAQGREEKTGDAKITPAFNLPSKYVLHTVGPIVYGSLTEKNEIDLRNCYLSCLNLAEENGLKSLAFCCISTGEFRFPNDRAAKIAIDTVKKYKAEKNSGIKVVFNVFKDVDEKIYKKLLALE